MADVCEAFLCNLCILWFLKLNLIAACLLHVLL